MVKVPYFKTSVKKLLRNPISTGELEAVLLMVNVFLPREILCAWNTKQRAIAEDWAIRLHLNASDNTTVRVPRKPMFVKVAEVRAKKMAPPERSAANNALLEARKKRPLASIFELLKG